LGPFQCLVVHWLNQVHIQFSHYFLHFFISSFLLFFFSSFLHFFISSFLHFFISSFLHFFFSSFLLFFFSSFLLFFFSSFLLFFFSSFLLFFFSSFNRCVCYSAPNRTHGQEATQYLLWNTINGSCSASINLQYPNLIES
jgi:hypothetical protein